MTTATYLPHPVVRKTRFAELGFTKVGRDWRIVALADTDNGWVGGTLCAVGPFYHSKAELLADLQRYARNYGAEG